MTMTSVPIRATPLALALASTVAATAAGGPAAAQGVFDDREARFSFAGVEFPAVVDTFAVMQASRWPAPELGVGLKYASPIEAELDLYVYPLPEGDETTGEKLEAEFRRELDGLDDYYARQEGQVEVESEGPTRIVTPSGVAYEGWLGELVLRRGAGSRRSILYLFEKDGRYLKYRITHHRGQREAMEPRILRFVGETLDRVNAG